MIKVLLWLLIAIILGGCDISNLFWEEEACQVANDVVAEERRLNPPQPLDDAEAAQREAEKKAV